MNGYAKYEKEISFAILVLLLYAFIFISYDSFQFDVRYDERFIWPTSLYLYESGIPGIDQLRTYNHLTFCSYPTPMTFIIFGGLEYIFHGGIFVGRLLNFLVSLVIIMIVALRSWKIETKTLLSVAGLVFFPFFFFTATQLYTDIIAAFFVLAGFIFHRKDRPVLSTVFFILAISSRQPLLAFPLALFFYEVLKSRKEYRKWIPPLLAVSSITFWFVLFGGFCPPSMHSIEGRPSSYVFYVFPDFGLYLLASIGLYFVIPEFFLFRRFRNMKIRFGKNELVVLAAILLLFIFFPPLGNPSYYDIKTMGTLDSAMNELFTNTIIRMSVYFVLAAIAAMRFMRPNLSTAFVLGLVVISSFAYITWDKYLLPLVIVLWYMKSRGILDEDALKPDIFTWLRSKARKLRNL